MSGFVCAHVIVKGRVQGVGYRFFCEREAGKCGVNGWVRNLRNGDVELELEGKEEDLKNMLESLRNEHYLASIDDIIIDWLEYAGSHQNFEIRPSA